MRASAAEETQAGSLVLLCLASWAIPGAGHWWLGRRSKGLIFFATLPLMFAIGLALRSVPAATLPDTISLRTMCICLMVFLLNLEVLDQAIRPWFSDRLRGGFPAS